jgi:hypothetical protein
MRCRSDKEIGLDIGDRHLRLSLDHQSSGLQGLLSQRFAGYQTTPSQDAVRIVLSTWRGRRKYGWSASSIDALAVCIRTALERYPQNHASEQRLATVLKILRHTDPNDAALRELNSGNGHRGTLVFALSGENLFFYQAQTRTAVILLKKTFRKGHMLAGAMNATMFALSHLLMASGGLLLHGCALQRNGKTVLFLGGSGAGKTTAARLCRPDVCFADDGVVLVKQGATFIVHPSPFCQIEANGNMKNVRAAAVERVVLLEKHAAEHVRALDKHELMLFILRHAIHFFKYMDDDTARKGFETVKHLIGELPVYRLQFTRDSDIWKLISP